MRTLVLSKKSWRMRTTAKLYINPISRDLFIVIITSLLLAVSLVTGAVVLINQL
jgi:hypothetical protein